MGEPFFSFAQEKAHPGPSIQWLQEKTWEAPAGVLRRNESRGVLILSYMRGGPEAPNPCRELIAGAPRQTAWRRQTDQRVRACHFNRQEHGRRHRCHVGAGPRGGGERDQARWFALGYPALALGANRATPRDESLAGFCQPDLSWRGARAIHSARGLLEQGCAGRYESSPSPATFEGRLCDHSLRVGKKTQLKEGREKPRRMSTKAFSKAISSFLKQGAAGNVDGP